MQRLVVEVGEGPQPVGPYHGAVGPVLDVEVQGAFQAEDLPGVLLGLGPAGRDAATGGGEPDLGVGGVGDPEEEKLQKEVRPGEGPAQEGHQRHVPEAGRDGWRVLGRYRRLVGGRGAGQERDGHGGGQGGQQDEVGAQRVQRRHVRQQHPARQGHDQDDGDGPYVPVTGASAGPADDREQHPQQLVLPGRG